jgi:transcriptional regulator with XRE-family HTH domain
MNTIPHQTWRDLLGKLTERLDERQRVARELGVSPLTVTRWVNGETEPRANNLRKIPEVFPEHQALFTELLLADYFPLASARAVAPPTDQRARAVPVPHEVPSEYLVRTVATHATTSGPFRPWMMRTLNLEQAIKLLDPDREVGMEITIVPCVPPRAEEPVRSLCELMGIGTPPWPVGIGRRLLFLGAESLAGWVVGRGEPGVVQDMSQEQGPLPFRPGTHEHSTAAYPFQREGKLAGCLLAICTQVDYFTPERLSILEVYANLLALSFRDEEFYALNYITLHEMPQLATAQQQAYTVQFRERARQLRRAGEFRLSEAEAEVRVLQELEAELLQVGIDE